MIEVVVGIDFGSSGSGFAYSFMNEASINHGNIYGANVDNKVPTEIILDNSYNILEFGSGCKQYLKEKGMNAGNYFKGIKMHLYSKKNEIESSNSKIKLPLKIVIKKVLEKLKELALEELKKLRKNISESNIKWIVTVSAIWEDFQKGIMMEACYNAGLINENTDKSLFFALEPEAASLYCSRNKDINQKYLEKGKYYIICDLGGGTGDIVAHLVGNNQRLDEIYCACGGDYGSNEIDRQIFEDLIFNLFGYKDFNSLHQKFIEMEINEEEEVLFDMWCELERQIRDFKEGANVQKILHDEKFPINFSIFQDFFKDEEIEDLISKFNSNFPNKYELNVKSKKRWVIELPYQIICDYIVKQANKICKVIIDIIIKSNKNIETIIFVGGYCSNEILIEILQNFLQNRIKTFLQPSKPCLAIMEGAVLFGINPKIIESRIAKYTLGVNFNAFWDDKKHSDFGQKYIDDETRLEMCYNCFDKFIEINQKLELDKTITHIYNSKDPRYCSFNFYKTLKTSPIFTFENGMEKFGQLILDAKKDYPYGEREIKVTMKFGGTFIDVNAIHVKSGNEIKATLTFN